MGNMTREHLKTTLLGLALSTSSLLAQAQEESAVEAAEAATQEFTGMNPEQLLDYAVTYGAKVVGALVGLFFGWIIAGWLSRSVRKLGDKRSLDTTLTRFSANIVRYLVLVAVVISVLGVFGIQTSSFAAIIGAAGLAVGLAFEGTLSNFAAGAMLLIFRPFKVGDLVDAGGVTGVVEEIELFTTVVKTLDNRKIILPNSKIFGDTIVNYGAFPQRRVDIDVGCDYSADIDETRAALDEAVAKIPDVLEDPKPQVFLKSLGGSSVDWQVRVWCETPKYWDVWQATIRQVKMTLDEKGIGIPFPQMDVHLDGKIISESEKK